MAYVIFCPVALYIHLRLNRALFEKEDFKKRWGFVYSGLKPNWWGWFFITTMRTSILLMIGIFSYNSSEASQLLLAMLWVVLYTGGLILARPFTNDGILRMELVSSFSMWLILYQQLLDAEIGEDTSVESNENSSKGDALAATMFLTVIFTCILLFYLMIRSMIATKLNV